MSLRTSCSALADAVRNLRLPSQLDVQTIKLTIVRRTWDGGEAGAGSPTDTMIVDLAQKYPVEHVTAAMIASSGGRYETRDVKVHGIPTAYTENGGGGYTHAELAPDGTKGVEVVYVLSGAEAGEYQLVELHSERATYHDMILRRRRTTP